MHLELLQEEQFKEQQKQLVIWSVIKSLTELQKFQKLHQKNNSETNNEEVLGERFMPPGLWHKILKDIKLFDDLRLI